MAALVGVLVFMTIFLSFVTGQANLTHTMSEQFAQPRMLSQAAQQELAFFQACSSFLQGFGAPANGQYIQVSDLVAAHLLPTSFPALTPFGQALQGWPVLNPANASITNLFVFPTGLMNTDALKAAGYGQYNNGLNIPVGVINTINKSVYSAVLAGLPAVTASANTQGVQSGLITIGQSNDLQLSGAAQTVLVSDTGVVNSALGGIGSAPAIEAIAPNQLGYTIIGFSSYGWALPWNSTYPVTISTGGNVTQDNLFANDNGFASMSLNMMGWLPVCPIGATLLSPGMSATQKNSTIDYNGSANASLSGVLCIQSYRTENINFVQSVSAQLLDVYRGVSGNLANYLVNGGSGTTSNN